MSRPKAVLWDMDGTLIDTEPLWGKATFELGELLGRPLTPEVRARTIGGSFPNTLSVVAEWAGYELKDGDLERYRTWMFDECQRTQFAKRAFVFPQAKKGLELLRCVFWHSLLGMCTTFPDSGWGRCVSPGCLRRATLSLGQTGDLGMKGNRVQQGFAYKMAW